MTMIQHRDPGDESEAAMTDEREKKERDDTRARLIIPLWTDALAAYEERYKGARLDGGVRREQTHEYTPLHEFIYDYEPANSSEARSFRVQIARLLQWVSDHHVSCRVIVEDEP